MKSARDEAQEGDIIVQHCRHTNAGADSITNDLL